MPPRAALASPHTPPLIAAWLLDLAMVAVLALVLVQCTVGLSPEIYWDVSPLRETQFVEASAAGHRDANAITVLGPASVAWLTVLSVATAGLALLAHGLAGGRIAWTPLALALVGAIFAGYHMMQDAGSLFRGQIWIGAVMLALAAFHLGQHSRQRRFMAAALIAMLIPLALHAITYLLFEHPATVEFFTQRERESVAQRGWTWESPQHLIYRRRLTTPEAGGVFGLSNVLGSLCAAMALLAAGASIGMLRPGRAVQALVPALAMASGWVAVLLTGSRGAMLAMALVMALLLAIWLIDWKWGVAWARGWRRHTFAMLATLMLVMAVGAVIARGMSGPPSSAEGERSLLFRFHYWQGAVRMLEQGPVRRDLLGVGPGNFKDLYASVKNPVNPEDVTSTHNVILDLVVMLGVGGVAWAALLLICLWRAARGSTAKTGEPGPPPEVEEAEASDTWSTRRRIISIVVVTVVVFGTQYGVQLLAAPLIENMLAWMVGMLAFAGITLLLTRPGWINDRWLNIGLFAAATMLLLHNQIEMTFYHQGAAALAWMVVGLAGGSGSVRLPPLPSEGDAGGWGEGDRRAQRPPSASPHQSPSPNLSLRRERDQKCGASAWPAIVMAGVLFLLAIFLVANVAVPVTAQQASMALAVERARNGDLDATQAALRRARNSVPIDAAVYSAQVEVLMVIADDAARRGDYRRAQQGMDEALVALDQAAAAGLKETGLIRLRAQVQSFAALMLRQPARMEEAASLWRQVTQRQPASISAAIDLADTFWMLGRADEARAEYRRALKLSDQAYLDPLTQLSETERGRIEARLKGR
ncbi:MAG: O-antigen ligase family protein [Phycisphaeraceae bacterium]